MIIDYINNIEDQRLTTILQLKRNKYNGRMLYCLGTGVQSSLLEKFLEKYGISFDGFCVTDNYYVSGQKKGSMEIQPLSKVIDDENADIVIGFQNYAKARELLYNSDSKCYFYYIDDPYYFYKMDFDWVLSHEKELQNVYEMLSDDFSKKLMIAFINTRLSGNPEEIYQLRSSDNEDYDYDLLEITEQEDFADIGAFTGDSIKNFLDYTNNRYQSIYAFEPDIGNFDKLKNNVVGKNICYINKGAWDSTKKLYFTEKNSSSSCISEEESTGISIEVTTIDVALVGKKITYLKMDVEGAELKALKGAVKMIQDNKPKLAICVYHRLEDIIAIPTFIDSLFEISPYHYYLRHHSSSLCETVFYAVPK